MPKASGPDCIFSVVDLKSCESEVFKALAKLSQMCLKESRLLVGLICGPVFKNVGGILLLQATALLDVVLWIVILIIGLLNTTKKCGLFSDFHYGFRYSRSNLDLLTFVSDRIATAFDRSVTWYITVALDISKGFDGVWHTGLLQEFI